MYVDHGCVGTESACISSTMCAIKGHVYIVLQTSAILCNIIVQYHSKNEMKCQQSIAVAYNDCAGA